MSGTSPLSTIFPIDPTTNHATYPTYRTCGEKASLFRGEDESPSFASVQYYLRNVARANAPVLDNRILPVEGGRLPRKRFADQRPSFAGCENQVPTNVIVVYFRLGGRRAYGLLKRSRRDCKTSRHEKRVSGKRESRRFSGWECQITDIFYPALKEAARPTAGPWSPCRDAATK
jgi:hypothetical protein